MIDYNAFLAEKFAETNNQGTAKTRLEFLSDMFGILAYNSKRAEFFARNTIEVCQVIAGKKPYDEIESREGSVWYLVMCNMPFFANRIKWGESAHSASWADQPPSLGDLSFTRESWDRFLEAVFDFSEGEYDRG